MLQTEEERKLKGDLLDRIRADFRVVANFFEWTPEERDEVAYAIKDACDGPDRSIVECWAAWLAVQADWTRQRVREAEARIKADMRARRAA